MLSKSFSLIFALILGTLLGFFLKGFFLVPAQPQIQPSPGSRIKEKIQALSDQEIAEYYALKNDAERLKKADEILAKMMTIFLHDLGIKLFQNTNEKSKNNLNSSDVQPPKDGQISLSDLKNKMALTQNQMTPVGSIADWKNVEKSRHYIKTEKERADFLGKVQIPDFDDALKQSSVFANKTGYISLLQGRFTGKADVKLNEKYLSWDIEMSINGTLEKGSFEGKSSIKLSRDGKVFSDSSGNGTLRAFREFNSDSDAILMRAGPDVYFQVYFLKDNDSLVGNVYYREEEDDPYKKIGTLQLRRGN
jgi:hypothetical protein